MRWAFFFWRCWVRERQDCERSRFWTRHKRLYEAVRRHGGLSNLLKWMRDEDLVDAALPEISKLGGASENGIAKVLPPVDELLP